MANPLGAPGWHLAPQRVHWTSPTSPKPASDQALCLQVKAASRQSPQRYINHFVNDNGGTRFIEAAFRGVRALNGGAQDMVENFKAEAPPGTLDDLIQHSKDYVDALSGELVGGPGVRLRARKDRAHHALGMDREPAAETACRHG
ncbi:MAG: hypothetical protein H0T90_06480 [Gemmatimonadales bacterium]|nr:hypothetical protein [Gemmatimonadales bacterium]